ncbi:hypothetical protein IBP95_003863 [Vibrio vulnificus]|nr:hypothetical protein [Vibrio vulnificus]
MKQMQYKAVVWGQVKANVYAGENCDQHERYIEAFADGDMDSANIKAFGFSASRFPAGTKFVIQVPVCPNEQCHLDAEFQSAEGKCECGFDWKNWTENKYS